MKKEETKHPGNKYITVQLFLSGDGPLEEKKAVLKRMLTRCRPTSVDQELFFLEGFRILDK